MRTLFKLWLAGLLLSLASPVEAQTQVRPGTKASVSITGTVASATVIVPGVAGQRIYVTAVALVPVATSVVTFTQGTGAGCGTGTSSVTGALTFTTMQVFSLGDGSGAVLALATGNSLCVTIATAAAPGSLAYDQF